MNEEAAKPRRENNGVSLLTRWGIEQDGWLRTIVAHIIATRAPMTESAVADAYDMLLVENMLTDGELTNSPQLEAPDISGSSREVFRLKRLSDVAGVNALASNQEIEFHDNLTVLYGENAAGKTGYSRILKRVAAVRGADAILADVHASRSASQSATISFALGATTDQYTWHGEAGVAPFTRVGVFDSLSATLHLDDNLAHLFTPADIALFMHVHSALIELRRKLQAELQARRSRDIPLSRFKRDGEVFPIVEGIDADTDTEALRQLASVTEEEAAELPTLVARVEELRPDGSGSRLQHALTAALFYKRISDALALFANFDWSGLRAALLVEKTARDTFNHAGADAFATCGVPGVLGPAWTRFLLAAEAYRSELDVDPYPEIGSTCLYCQQPLVGAAVELVDLYRKHVTGSTRTALDEAQAQTAHLKAPLIHAEISSLEKEIAQQLNSYDPDQTLIPLLTRARDALAELIDVQRSFSTSNELVDYPSPKWVRAAFETNELAHTAQELAGVLREEAAGLESIRASIVGRVVSIENRLLLRGMLSELEEVIEDAQWRRRASILEKSFQGLLKSITEQAKIASERLLNAEFEKHFASECEALRAPKVTLDFSGKKGKAERRKTIASNSRLSSVLSEGEQKVIALADFLAEMSTGEETSPIIFDDPVNSLDYRRMEYVVDRLLDLAGARQVVIFSHNIYFAISLLNAARERKLGSFFYQISRDDGRIGLVSLSGGPRTDSISELSGKINKLIEAAGGTDGDVRAALIEQAYAFIRSWCEVVVELEMLSGVTRRYQAQVSITQLDKIDVERFAALRPTIMTLYKKACRAISAHSQPIETLGVRPTLDELRSDWKSGLDARTVFKSAR